MAWTYSSPGYLAVVQDTTTCSGLYGAGQYGLDTYKICGAGGTEVEKLHYYALKKLFPAPQIAGYLDDMWDVMGKHLDLAYYAFGYKSGGLHDQIFADTCTDLLGEWERNLEITEDTTGSTSDRRAAILTQLRALGRLDIDYFEGLATSLGYTISIAEGEKTLFRVGTTIPPATALPAPLFSPWTAWKWTVTVTGVSSADDLEALFSELKPAHTLVEFVYA